MHERFYICSYFVEMESNGVYQTFFGSNFVISSPTFKNLGVTSTSRHISRGVLFLF